VDVYEIKLKVFLYSDVPYKEVPSVICGFIDKGLSMNAGYSEYHTSNTYKYSFGGFYPVERSRIYRKEAIYQFTVRTCDEHLARYLCGCLPECSTERIKGLVGNMSVIPRGHIITLYTLTPVIVKSESGGYRRDDMTVKEFEKRLKVNLIKKYNLITNQKLDEDFELYNLIEFTNHKPIAVKYKDIKLLSDKVELKIADNVTAQDLAYMALGTGLCEMNARGFGYLSYHML
jgi:CRISPR-associated endoribonuclease Cas6